MRRPRPDSFFDEHARRRPGANYDDNYAAGAVEGGYRERQGMGDPGRGSFSQRGNRGYSHGMGSGQGGPGQDRGLGVGGYGAAGHGWSSPVPERGAEEFDAVRRQSTSQDTRTPPARDTRWNVDRDLAAHRYVEERLAREDEEYHRWREMTAARLRQEYLRRFDHGAGDIPPDRRE